MFEVEYFKDEEQEWVVAVNGTRAWNYLTEDEAESIAYAVCLGYKLGRDDGACD